MGPPVGRWVHNRKSYSHKGNTLVPDDMEDGGSWSEGQGPNGMAGGIHTTLIHFKAIDL